MLHCSISARLCLPSVQPPASMVTSCPSHSISVRMDPSACQRPYTVTNDHGPNLSGMHLLLRAVSLVWSWGHTISVRHEHLLFLSFQYLFLFFRLDITLALFNFHHPVIMMWEINHPSHVTPRTPELCSRVLRPWTVTSDFTYISVPAAPVIALS